MGHQPQVVPHQLVAGIPPGHTARAQGCKGRTLGRRGKRPWEAATFEMQRQIQNLPGCRLQKHAQNAPHSNTPYPFVCGQGVVLCSQQFGGGAGIALHSQA